MRYRRWHRRPPSLEFLANSDDVRQVIAVCEGGHALRADDRVDLGLRFLPEGVGLAGVVVGCAGEHEGGEEGRGSVGSGLEERS